jgi:hypothetical protein
VRASTLTPRKFLSFCMHSVPTDNRGCFVQDPAAFLLLPPPPPYNQIVRDKIAKIAPILREKCLCLSQNVCTSISACVRFSTTTDCVSTKALCATFSRLLFCQQTTTKSILGFRHSTTSVVEQNEEFWTPSITHRKNHSTPCLLFLKGSLSNLFGHHPVLHKSQETPMYV